jgi:hypothetical protein
MRKPMQVLGIVMILFVVSRVDVLAGYELFANLILAVLGVVVVVAAERAPA